VNRPTFTGFALIVIFLFSFAACGQAPAAPSQAQPPVAVANPHYVSVLMEIDVNRPAAEVWKRVGKFCDIGEWLQIPCSIVSGKDGELGVVRTASSEIMVARTELSYTYVMPAREGRPYNQYHGTLEARPITATTCKLLYSLLFDNSMLASDEARESDIASKRAIFTNALANMKVLAEGGTLPPAQPRSIGRGATPPRK